MAENSLAPTRKMTAVGAAGVLVAPIANATAIAPVVIWVWSMISSQPMPLEAAVGVCTLIAGLMSFVAGYMTNDRK